MKKLTKEQAEWLVEKIKLEAHEQCFGSGNLNYAEMVEMVINKCTEKEFPTFLLNKGVSEFSLAILEGEGNSTHVSISDPNWQKMQMTLNYEEFKQFTEGCQRICEYLDEQKCSE